MTETHLSELAFASLDLVPSVAQGIRDAGFVRATPVQAMTLPIALTGKDVAGQAQTGTGKTAAFLVALYQRLLTNPLPPGAVRSGIRALILAPTRELAVQIFNDAEVLGKHTGLKIGVVYGGVDYEKQRKTLQDGIDVLIGTPGRVIDYFKQHVFDMRHAQAVVLDEADRMFDLGFIADIRFILRRLPKPEARQSMLFSATLSQRVLELAYEHMNNPELVRIEPDRVTADKVRQMIYFPAMEEKDSAAHRAAAPVRRAPHDGVREHQARGGETRGLPDRQRLQGAGAVGRRAAEEAPAFHERVPQRRARGADLPRTSPRAACTSPTSATSSTTTCRRTPPTTCIASAAPRAPAPRATPSASAARNTRCRCRRSRTYITHKIPVAPVKLELLARDLKPPVYKEWDPEDGPSPCAAPAVVAAAAAVRVAAARWRWRTWRPSAAQWRRRWWTRRSAPRRPLDGNRRTDAAEVRPSWPIRS